MRKGLVLSFLFVALGIAACGGQPPGDGSGGVPARPGGSTGGDGQGSGGLSLFARLGLDGAWQTNCWGSEDDAASYRSTLTFEGELILLSKIWYQGRGCAGDRALVRWQETHERPEAMERADLPGWTTIRFVARKVTVTPVSPDGAARLSRDRAYGLETWREGQALDVSGYRYGKDATPELTAGNAYRRTFRVEAGVLRQARYDGATARESDAPALRFFRMP